MGAMAPVVDDPPEMAVSASAGAGFHVDSHGAVVAPMNCSSCIQLNRAAGLEGGEGTGVLSDHLLFGAEAAAGAFPEDTRPQEQAEQVAGFAFVKRHLAAGADVEPSRFEP